MKSVIAAPDELPPLREVIARHGIAARKSLGQNFISDLNLTDRIADYQTLTLMFQREVAERLVAAPRTPAYGRLSVIVQWLCEPRILFDLPPRAFVPPPKVTSSVVRLTPRAAPLAPASKAALERVTAAAFGQRRKMLRASLKTLGVAPEPLLAAAGISPTARAEELSVAQFCAIASYLPHGSGSGCATP